MDMLRHIQRLVTGVNNNMKKSIIYGIGKLQKDFQYIFDDIEIAYYIEDEEEINNSIYNNTFSVDSIMQEKEEFIVYVCKRDKEKASSKLERIGLTKGKDYIFADELFHKLDFDIKEIKKKKKIAVWGRGNNYKNLIEKGCISYEDIDVFFDSNMENKTEKLVDYRKISNINDYFVIVTVKNYFYEIEKILHDKGIESDSYISYVELMRKNSELLKKTYYDNTYGDNYPVCNMPFEYTTVAADGTVELCCGTFITCEGVGNLYYENYIKVWKGVRAKIHRLAVLNRTYSFCNGLCSFLNAKEKNGECYEEYEKVTITEKPRICIVNIDGSCNLYCSSCRNSIYIARKGERQELDKLKDILKEQMVNVNPEWMGYAGNGEVFVSDVYRELLLSHKKTENNHLFLLSNGNLFTLEKFKELSRNFSDISVTFSVDAVSEETYNKIRRGGNFKKLIDNIKMVAQMRKDGVISKFTLAFVLQYDNVHEARDFVLFAKENNVDRVIFSRMCNWGTYSDEEFEKRSLYDEKGLIKDEYKKHFEDKVFEEKIVDMGTAASAFENNNFYVHNIISDCKVRDIRKRK